MLRYIDVKDAINKEEKIFIDVRSPFEYSEGTIPNAINIPLFNNEERIEIGSIYKNIGIEEAKIKGIKYASKKLPFFYENLLQLSKTKKDIIIFCFRGGLRSTSIVSFLNNLGIMVYQLRGGYRAFRRFVIEYLDKVNNYHEFIVLHGYTGVGKTQILKTIEKENVGVLNIESLAKNTGSVFGNIVFGGNKTINQKNFEALIVNILLASKKRIILVESESKRIGNVIIPNKLYKLMLEGRHIFIQTSLENRIERLVKDYTKNIFNNNLLIESILNLKSRIGNEKVLKYIEYIKKHEYEAVARELIISYYDPLYKPSIEKFNYDLIINYDRIDQAIDIIKNYYHTIEKETKL